MHAQGIAPAWTLCVEVAFYLSLPLLVVAMHRLTPRLGWRRAALSVIACMIAVGFAFHLLDTLPLAPWASRIAVHGIYNLPGQAAYFAAGMLLAVLSVDAQAGGAPGRIVRRFAARPGDAWSLALLMYILAAFAGAFMTPIHFPLIGVPGFPVRFMANAVFVWLFVFMLLVPPVFAQARDGLHRRVLAWRPLAYAGVISYGVYLWHGPLGQWLMANTALGDTASWPVALGWPVRVAVLLAASVACAIVSYQLVELPFLRLKRGWRRRRPGQAERGGAPPRANPAIVAAGRAGSGP
jgi:peptidoglycan/LPS O-acetylase OafA/YrhL